MKKELAKVYKEIVNLSKMISGLLKGEEPNMQLLWGMAQGEKESTGFEAECETLEELSLEDLQTLKTALDTIKTNICDYYAEKYSNECNLQ